MPESYYVGDDYELGAYELGQDDEEFTQDEAAVLLRALAAGDQDYYVGAAPSMPRRPRAPAGMRSMPLRPPMTRGALRVRERQPREGRVLWLGFKSPTTIAATATANVTARPQDTFSTRKIVIPATVAPNFEINDVKIGNISQFSSSDPIPAESFIPDGVSTDVKFDTAQVSQDITFNVTNISGAAATFRASINGYVARL